MSFSPFKEVSTANPGTETRYGSDDLLDLMKIFNGKIVSGRRPDILNPWRFSAAIELKQTLNPAAPVDANTIILYNDQADNKLKVKKSGGTVVNIEDLGSGAWNNSAAETITNKTIPIESNFIKHGTTNFVGDILYYDGTRYNRKAKGAANQVLAVNAAATDLEWQTPAGGGGGGGEANTASNIGTAGIGFFAQKIGLNLEFKKVFSPTGTILISDNVANERVDLDLGAGIVTVNQTNTYGDFQQTFRSSKLAITNPANTFAYFLIGSAITASRNITLPLLTANDTLAMVTFAQTLVNKTMSASVFDVDTNTLKHSTTNVAGELLRNNGTKFLPLAKGAANTYLRVNPAGTDLEYGNLPAATGGVRLPADNSIASTTGRWGAFYGGSGNGMGMLGFQTIANRIHGTTLSSLESITQLFTGDVAAEIAEFKTGCGFRRDSNAVFKLKWAMSTSSGFKVKIGLSSATSLPAGGGGGLGSPVIRYDVTQNSADHMEMDGSISRLGVRFNSGAGGLGEVVTEVVVRFRKYGTPSGSATVGIRKNSDGSLITLGSFSPNSFGSGEQTTTITASSPTYVMLANDRVTVEFPANDTNGLELDEDDAGPPAGFTSQSWNGSTWSNTTEAIGLRIKTAPVISGGGSGNTPLDGAHGIMIHGSTEIHSNYQIARNNGAGTQTTQDSAKPLANTSTHTAEININSTNIVVILDGTSFTYTTFIPATSTAMTLYLHIENITASSRGLGIAYGQVVLS